MSFSVNGSTWTPQTAQQHANNMLASINSILQSLGLPILVASYANIVWLFCLAAGAIAASFDLALNSAKNSFNIATCDDAQIYNLLPIAGTSLIPASYSTLQVNITAVVSGACVVTSGMHITVNGISNKFIVGSTVTVPAGQVTTINTTADSVGPIAVVSGQVTGIAESPANLASVNNTVASITGSSIETALQARTRLLNGNVVGINIDGLVLNLRALAGIQYANAYFNVSPSTSSGLVGSALVPPRTCYMVVYGNSPYIGSTYWGMMTAPTYSMNNTYQNITTLSNQVIPIKFDYAVLQNVYIKVYVSAVLPKNSGYDIAIANYITSSQSSVNIGQIVTSEYISTILANFPYATINGVLVSVDNVNFGRTAIIAANAVPIFSNSNITIILE